MITTGQLDRVDRYEQFFGFGEAPFGLAPNPRYLFESASHAAALAQVAYAIERREPLVVVTGEIGTGKTLLCRTVLQRMGRQTFVSVINNPQLERDDLLKQLLQDFGVISKDRTKLTALSRHDLVHALEDFLTSLIPLQAHAVVVIDEAQHIQPDVLEQIRLLSNIDDERGTMLQIILVGQADLDAILSHPDLRQFQQRVSRRLRLEPLSADELRFYVEHRLAVGRRTRTSSQMTGARELERALAEWDGTAADVTFTADAMQALWTRSGGIARVVNVLCDRALEAAYARRSRIVDAGLINTAGRALDRPAPPVTPSPAPEPILPADAHSIAAAAESRPAAAPWRGKRTFGLATAVAAAAALWFGARALDRQGNPRRADIEAAVASAPGPDVHPATAPPSQSPPVMSAAAPTTTPADTTAAGSTAAGREVSSDRFEIVVASFRTDARAAAVEVDVASLGLPVRRRVAGGWQQVIGGPFGSRAAADDAQQRLAGAGLTQTVVVRQGQTPP